VVSSISSSSFVNFSNWCDFHSFSYEAVVEFCCSQLHSRHHVEKSSPPQAHTLGLKEAQSLIKSAFVATFPDLSQEIQDIFDQTQVEVSSFPDGVNPPFYLETSNGNPTIAIELNGTPRSIVDLAHEYGHALQARFNNGLLIAPAYREVFAFLSELAFLDYVKANDQVLFSSLAETAMADDAAYLNSDFEKFVSAATSDDVEYNYRWNYPVARYLANWIWEYFEREQVQSLFSDSGKFHEIIDVNQILRTSASNNYLPQIGKYEDGSPQSVYAQLGMMAMLDIDYWQGNSENLCRNSMTSWPKIFSAKSR